MLMRLKLFLNPGLIKKIIIILLAIFIAVITTSFGFGIKDAHGGGNGEVYGPAPRETIEPEDEAVKAVKAAEEAVQPKKDNPEKGKAEEANVSCSWDRDQGAFVTRIEAIEKTVSELNEKYENLEKKIEKLEEGQNALVYFIGEVEQRLFVTMVEMQVRSDATHEDPQETLMKVEANERDILAVLENLISALDQKKKEAAEISESIQRLKTKLEKKTLKPQEKTEIEKNLKDSVEKQEKLQSEVSEINRRASLYDSRRKRLQLARETLETKIKEKATQPQEAQPQKADAPVKQPTVQMKDRDEHELIRMIIKNGFKVLDELNVQGKKRTSPSVSGSVSGAQENDQKKKGRGRRELTAVPRDPEDNRLKSLIDLER